MRSHFDVFVDFSLVLKGFGAHSTEQLLEVLKTAEVLFFLGAENL